jgi:hypothetical protein
MSYHLIKSYVTNFGKSYSGPAQEATMYFQTWGPDQIEFVDQWFGVQSTVGSMVQEAISAVENKGGTPIQVQAYRDKSPTWYTKYRVVITAKVPAGMSQQASMGYSPAFWLAVMGLLLAISWMANKTLQSVRDLVWGPHGEGNFLGIPWVGWVALAIVGAYALSQRSNRRKHV